MSSPRRRLRPGHDHARLREPRRARPRDRHRRRARRDRSGDRRSREPGRRPTSSSATADLYALDFADDTFDIVHAHQVLQHVPDPVGALREMRRVCKPGGVVAARDGDYDAFTWYPADPRLDAWQTMYRAVARANQGEPNAGRFLLAWAHAAGFTDVEAGASTWCYATPEDRAWWGDLWADRITESAIATQAVEIGAATARRARRTMADAWRAWAAEPDGWFAVLHGEILARGVDAPLEPA